MSATLREQTIDVTVRVVSLRQELAVAEQHLSELLKNDAPTEASTIRTENARLQARVAELEGALGRSDCHRTACILLDSRDTECSVHGPLSSDGSRALAAVRLAQKIPCLDREVGRAKGATAADFGCLVETPLDPCVSCVALAALRDAFGEGP